MNTVSFIESFAPTTHYNYPRCCNGMLWLCCSPETVLETLFATRDIVFRFDATLDFLKFWSFGLLFVQMRFDLMIKMITLTPHVSQSDLREICQNSASPHISLSRLSSHWYFATTSQVGQFCLRASEMLQTRLKQVRLIDVLVATS